MAVELRREEGRFMMQTSGSRWPLEFSILSPPLAQLGRSVGGHAGGVAPNRPAPFGSSCGASEPYLSRPCLRRSRLPPTPSRCCAAANVLPARTTVPCSWRISATIRIARSRSSGGCLFDVPDDMTPSFPRNEASGNPGVVQTTIYLHCWSFFGQLSHTPL